MLRLASPDRDALHGRQFEREPVGRLQGREDLSGLQEGGKVDRRPDRITRTPAEGTHAPQTIAANGEGRSQFVGSIELHSIQREPRSHHQHLGLGAVGALPRRTEKRERIPRRDSPCVAEPRSAGVRQDTAGSCERVVGMTRVQAVKAGFGVVEQDGLRWASQLLDRAPQGVPQAVWFQRVTRHSARRKEADLGRDLKLLKQIPCFLGECSVRLESLVVDRGVQQFYACGMSSFEKSSVGTSPVKPEDNASVNSAHKPSFMKALAKTAASTPVALVTWSTFTG